MYVNVASPPGLNPNVKVKFEPVFACRVKLPPSVTSIIKGIWVLALYPLTMVVAENCGKYGATIATILKFAAIVP